jgi:two-component system NtrC family sensor kinase
LVQSQIKRHLATINNHIDDLKEMGNIGLSLTASLDLDHVLTAIVETAVKVTGAEEGSLLILDEVSGELFMRAARNFQDEFVRTFRLPVNDTLAGEVIRTGSPVVISKDTLQKIKTTYLVRNLMYVPLQVRGKVIGVLGVDNRIKGLEFTKQHLTLVSTLADYAAVAIENANLYSNTEVERYKLDAILTQIEDGVIVVGEDKHIILINRAARMMFKLVDEDVYGKPIQEILHQDTILDLFLDDQIEAPYRCEIALADGYILNTHLVNIPGVGLAVTMQDITYFKELDQIKTDFVNTISHDLRSPLTAILGYVELITRVGEVNEQQLEFINRVQKSVRNISELVNALLELGRIEAGFDTEKEFISLGVIVEYSIDSFKSRIDAKNQMLTVEISENLPEVFGNPIHLRQIADNLIGNAVRYTPNGGRITIQITTERDQIIFQVADSGLGIPLTDQAYIFDKFYRARNVPEDIVGSGLGLAIVKSIVENHQGRVWVESAPEVGSCFTVVLPIHQENNLPA